MFSFFWFAVFFVFFRTANQIVLCFVTCPLTVSRVIDGLSENIIQWCVLNAALQKT